MRASLPMLLTRYRSRFDVFLTRASPQTFVNASKWPTIAANPAFFAPIEARLRIQTDLDTWARFGYFPAPHLYQTEQRMSSAAVPHPAAPGAWARIQDLILPIGMIASVLVIMVPVPAELMDLLLAANITIAVIMLLTTLYVRTPLEFNIFPSLLLATTLFRLVLNVATTRLILTRAGSDGHAGGGRSGADLRRVRHRRRPRAPTISSSA